MMGYLAVALGGAFGAMGRHGVNGIMLRLMGPNLPFGTLTVNVLGSLAMGLAIGLFARHLPVSHEIRLLVTTGFLGGFTTFSAFSLDTVVLVERGQAGAALAYIGLSVGLSIGALFIGLMAIRSLT